MPCLKYSKLYKLAYVQINSINRCFGGQNYLYYIIDKANVLVQSNEQDFFLDFLILGHSTKLVNRQVSMCHVIFFNLQIYKDKSK